MEERILAVKELYDAGIDKSIFFKLLLHSTDGPTNEKQAYANYLTIDEWKKLYSREFVNINVTDNELLLFFNYMIKYSVGFFGKSKNEYFVYKTFTKNLRTEDNFQFELILLTTFELI